MDNSQPLPEGLPQDIMGEISPGVVACHSSRASTSDPTPSWCRLASRNGAVYRAYRSILDRYAGVEALHPGLQEAQTSGTFPA